jgi:hypothetical protein
VADDVQLPTVVSDDGEVLPPEDTVAHLARRDRDHLRALQELQDAIREAQEWLLDERNTVDIDGRREPTMAGYSDLARRFQIETTTVDSTIEWEPNHAWLRHGEGDPVAEHCRAKVRVRAVAPWGHAVERERVCSTRGKEFHYSSGGFNEAAYMEAEHICAGKAETRAANAAIKALLGLTGPDEEEAYGAQEGADRRERKRASGRLATLRKRWTRLLRENGITREQEEALARAHDALPSDLDAWDEDADYYEYALDLVSRYGTRVFDRAVEVVQEEDGLEEAEQKAGTGPETEPCPEDGCDGRLEPGMRACPECGWDRDGPPPAGGEAPDGPPETEDDETSAADDFEKNIRENPLPEDHEGDDPEPQPELGAEEEDPGPDPDEPSGDDGPLARRSKTISRIMTLTKRLGEDRTYPQLILGSRVRDGAGQVDLDRAETSELEQILERLEDEVADMEGGGE